MIASTGGKNGMTFDGLFSRVTDTFGLEQVDGSGWVLVDARHRDHDHYRDR